MIFWLLEGKDQAEAVRWVWGSEGAVWTERVREVGVSEPSLWRLKHRLLLWLRK